MTDRRPAVYGVRETLKTLQGFDRKAKLRAIQRMKTAAKPMVAAMESRFPAGPPLSGFAHNGRTGWKGRPKLTVKYGGRAPRDADEWPLLRIILGKGTPAAAALFDLAADGNLGAQLSARWGDPSRAMWRVSDKLRDDTTRAVLDAIEQTMKETNQQLAVRGDL